ncbi:MAG: PQQ-binding-like beta-propeller repeat protein [Chloroflexi bacterium]|nr:PQQ-binding-like beta-propeller repeat protein [Chloroflexota bacterium]
MKPNRILLLLFLLIFSVSLSGCRTTTLATSWPGVTADQEKAYAAYGSYVMAINLSNGSQAWQYPEKAENGYAFYAAPTLADGQLIAGTYSNILVSINPDSGALNWEFNQAKGRYVASAAVVGDTILAPSADHTLYALDLKGNLLWTFTTGHSLWAAPLVEGEDVYLSSMDHFLYKLKIADGSSDWKTDLGGAIVSTPVAGTDGQIYVSTLVNEVLAVQTSDGSILWRFKADDAVWSNPLLVEGTLYFGDLKGKIYALDASNGSLKWSQEVGGSLVAAPAAKSDGILFADENGDLIAMGYGGQKLWTRTIGDKLYTAPLITEGKILVPVTKGENLIVALDDNGNQLWTFIPPK